jgi:hypothetical protein
MAGSPGPHPRTVGLRNCMLSLQIRTLPKTRVFRVYKPPTTSPASPNTQTVYLQLLGGQPDQFHSSTPSPSRPQAVLLRDTPAPTLKKTYVGPRIESCIRISQPRHKPSIPSCRGMMWAHSRAIQTSVVAESAAGEAFFGGKTRQKPAPTLKFTHVGPVYRVARPHLATQARPKHTIVSRDDVSSQSDHPDIDRSRVTDGGSVVRRRCTAVIHPHRQCNAYTRLS